MPGRNDTCPCGSGKKYKKCCLRADEDAGRSRKPMEHIDDLMASVFTLIEMLAPGGVLGTVRFEEQAFAAAIDQHGPEVTGGQPISDVEAVYDRLIARCYPQLATADWYDRAEHALSDALALKLPGSRKRALSLAWDTLRVGADDPEPVAPPLAMATFDVQLRELQGA